MEESRPRAALPARLALAGLLLLAALLRLTQLEAAPAGLHIDEASHGVLALEILGGGTPVFFSSYTGHEAGYAYLVALAMRIFGNTALAVRLPAALLGVALVWLTWLLARRLLGERGALLAAAAAAAAPWLVHLQRIGFRANLLPVTLTAWAVLALRALDSGRRRDWLLSGLPLGLTAYTYLASRLVPALVALWLIGLALTQRPLLRRQWRGVAAMLACAALVALPLVIHFIRVPSDWSARTEQIGACGAGVAPGDCLATALSHAAATFGMVGWRGDPIGFFNQPGAPAMPIWLGWLFYAGLALALRRWRDPAWLLLLLWWPVMALPGILSADSPHYLRTIGLAAPTLVLWAAPLDRAWGWARARWGLRPGWGWAAGALLVAGLAGSTVSQYRRWLQRPELYYDYMGYATDAAAWAASLPPDATLLISEDYDRHATYLHLAPRTAGDRWFDARVGWIFPPEGRAAQVILSVTTPPDPRISAVLAGGSAEPVSNGAGQYAYTRVTLPADRPPTAPLSVALALPIEAATLTGVALPAAAAPGTRLPVTLDVAVAAPAAQEARLFIHLIDPAGRVVAQHDSLSYPALAWRPGDRFRVWGALDIPADAPPGEYAALVGFYDTASGRRWSVPGAPDDAFRLGTVRVGPER
ncbi:MAG TPA: glycosyltransferase family 39 protein [Herpetosiphonaceae bacterium]